jgi:hypothetical protein
MPQDSGQAERYGSLKDYVSTRAGARGRANGRLRDRLVEIAVEEFPVDATDDEQLPALRGRMKARVKQEYGFILSSIIIGVLIQFLAQLVIDWWRERRKNKTLMVAWQYAAQNPQLPPKDGG